MVKKQKTHNTDSFPVVVGLFLMFLASVLFFTGFEISTDAEVEGKLISATSRVKGMVENVYLVDNQEVQKGDLLLEIDSKYYEQQLKNAEAELTNARVKLLLCEKPEREDMVISEDNMPKKSLIDAKYGFDKSELAKLSSTFAGSVQKRKDVTSLKNLKIDAKKEKEEEERKNSQTFVVPMSPQDNQTVVTEEEYDMIDVCELRKKIKKLEARVADCKLELSNTRVYAMQDGTISTRNVKVGDNVEIGQELFTLVPKRVWISAQYPISKIDNLRVGQSAYIRIANYPNKVFKGVVGYVGGQNEALKVQSPDNPEEVNLVIPVRVVFTKDYSDYNFLPKIDAKVYVRVR